MKKWLLVLGMITCILGLTACGSKTEEVAETLPITEEQAIQFADQLIENMNMVVSANMEEQFAEDEVLTGAFDSWKSAQTDMGSYKGIVDHEVEIGSDSAVIKTTISGTKKNAEVEMILDKNLQVTSVSTNVIYSFGELMINAALNTLLGMGTVFVGLILISVIISAFILIPKIQAAFSKKETKEDVKTEAVNNAVAQIEEAEELSDDLELVAVIAAAIAASEGAASTDGFVVRSIKRASTNKWQRA